MQSLLMPERLWVTVTAQENLHDTSLKLHVSRCIAAFVVLQTSSQLTSIISSAVFSVLCSAFNTKEIVSISRLKNLLWMYEARVSEM